MMTIRIKTMMTMAITGPVPASAKERTIKIIIITPKSFKKAFEESMHIFKSKVLHTRKVFRICKMFHMRKKSFVYANSFSTSENVFGIRVNNFAYFLVKSRKQTIPQPKKTNKKNNKKACKSVETSKQVCVVMKMREEGSEREPSLSLFTQ